MSNQVCHIWIGQFGPESPDDYFVQTYGDDAATSCRFAAEQGEARFDYDFVEISFPNELEPVRSLVDGHSYANSYLDSVIERAAAIGITEANVFILSNKNEFSTPRSVSGPGYRLAYLGEFECDTDA